MKALIKNTAIIIPIYNSKKYLAELFERILEFFPKENIIAVNDASTDGSDDICRKLKVELVSIKENTGKGNAIQLGFKKALEKDLSFAFTIDSDLQHQPEDIPGFLEIQNSKEFEMVIGRRDFSFSKMPFARICSNSLTSWILSFVTKTTILDSQSGYRLYNLEILKDLQFTTKRYQFETEIILKLIRAGGKIGFTKIDTIYDGQISHISNLRDIKNFIEIVFIEMIQNLKNS